MDRLLVRQGVDAAVREIHAVGSIQEAWRVLAAERGALIVASSPQVRQRGRLHTLRYPLLRNEEANHGEHSVLRDDSQTGAGFSWASFVGVANYGSRERP